MPFDLWQESHFERYWNWLIDEFRMGTRHLYSPRAGNTRQIEHIDSQKVSVKEITARGAPSACKKSELHEDFRKLFEDPHVRDKKITVLRKEYRITNLVEFKWAMFVEFLQFAEQAPTTDPLELDERVRLLLETPLITKPLGNSHPSQVIVQAAVFERLAEVKAWALNSAGGRCEACGLPAPFSQPGGLPFLEVHHVVPLSNGGPDTIENCVAVCPNCHRRCHFSEDKSDFSNRLYDSVTRLCFSGRTIVRADF